jgi:ribosomal protein L7/L12
MDSETSEHIYALTNEVRRLEQLVTNVYEHLGIAAPQPEPPGNELPPEVRALVDSGNAMQAIQLYRELTRLGLAEAKSAIDAYANSR